MEPVKTKVSDLKLGDKVKLFDGAYGTATVYQITEDYVMVWRPFVKTEDFSYSGNRVIPYVGIEDFSLYFGSHVVLLEHGPEMK